jgi:hypothetical protein
MGQSRCKSAKILAAERCIALIPTACALPRARRNGLGKALSFASHLAAQQN